MMVVPPAVLDILELKAGAVVGMTIDGERLVIEPRKRPRYTMDELLSQCDFTIPASNEEQEWMDVAPVGEEVL